MLLRREFCPLSVRLSYQAVRSWECVLNCYYSAMIDTPMLDQVAAGLGTASSGEMFGAGPSPAVGRLGDADEVAELIAFLLSPASGFMTGAVVPIDGGLLC